MNEYRLERALSDEEKQKRYPMLTKFIGMDNFDIEIVSGPGMASAHMMFAPKIERALKAAAEEKLWDAFTFKVSVRRKRKNSR